MAYRVTLVDLAEAELSEYVETLRKESESAAVRWFEAFIKLQDEIAEYPAAFSLAPEAFLSRRRWQSANFYSHRVIFRVIEEEGLIEILRVYHGARRPLRRTDVDS